VGRENGDIEIWNPYNWYQEKIIRGGGSDRAIDGLTWVTNPTWTLDNGKVVGGAMRLFSIGLTSTITEWDIAKGVPRRHASGIHGEIWCLEALPAAEPGGGVSSLVAGTNKGELVLYSVEDDQLRFERVLARPPQRGGRRAAKKLFQITSLAFRGHRAIIAGCSDNSIRIFDFRSGNFAKRVTVNSRRRGVETIVWSVKCLPDGDIVSADEGGQISIWDARTLTLAQTLQAHSDHAVCLAVSSDGSTIVTGGNDSRLKVLRKGGENGIWDVAQSRKHHVAEIKVMASFESPGRSVVISAGSFHASNCLFAGSLLTVSRC
jgi:U3 small nucleolar RNA-associated protein 4